MTERRTIADQFTSTLTTEDHVDLVDAASKRSPRMRAMLWAMVSPDGLVRSVFGKRAFVHDAAAKAEACAARAGFVCFNERDRTLSEPRTRIDRRWRPEYREGVSAFAGWADPTGRHEPVFVNLLNEPVNREQAARLYALLSAEPSMVELLPALPRSRFGDLLEPSEWAVSAVERLELVGAVRE